jgi:hypothetical protein
MKESAESTSAIWSAKMNSHLHALKSAGRLDANIKASIKPSHIFQNVLAHSKRICGD